MMKKLLPALVLFLLPIAAFAQQGTIRYDATVKIDIQLPPGMEHMADQIPDSRTSGRLLYFTDAAALIKDAPKAETDEAGAVNLHGDGFAFRMAGSQPEEETFYDFDSGQVVEKTDFLGRTFRINGEMEEFQWRLTGDHSEYLGFKCQRAIAEHDSSTVDAWFTTEIPVSAGPAGLTGLPGMILVANFDNGQRTYTATEVDLETEIAGMITPPTGGKEVSREEYDNIVEEKMKEMGATRGRGGNKRVMIHN
ncbi:MAG: GLPGLI family protein [Rhodothermales bacterium]|jgi:GLPGLI family protein